MAQSKQFEIRKQRYDGEKHEILFFDQTMVNRQHQRTNERSKSAR
jgi:hypothetical protein